MNIVSQPDVPVQLSTALQPNATSKLTINVNQTPDAVAEVRCQLSPSAFQLTTDNATLATALGRELQDKLIEKELECAALTQQLEAERQKNRALEGRLLCYQ